MVKASVDGWLLETALPVGQSWHAWVSNPEREVVGYGAGVTEQDAIKDAVRAWNTGRYQVRDAMLKAAGS